MTEFQQGLCCGACIAFSLSSLLDLFVRRLK